MPFMMQVFQIREEKRAQIPAVTHVDGSGRLQTVHRDANPRYHRLIECFRDADRRANGAQHLVQRERAGRLPAGRGARLLPAHQDGCAGDGGFVGVSAVREMNLRTIAAKLAAGQLHYALGRFYRVRRTYGVISGLRRPPIPPDTRSVSIFKRDVTDAAVRLLHDDGIALGFDLPARITADIREYAERSPCRRSGDRRQFAFSEVSGGRLPDGKPVILGMVDDPRACPEIDRLCADPILLTVASQYLGYRPQHVEPRLYWSFVCDATRKDRLAQWQTLDYHFDVDGYSFIYANFYITAVDRNCGAHAYIRGSHKRKPSRMLLHSANQPDEIVLKHFGKESEVVVEGGAGYGFLEDASCYHKALAPKTRERLMLQIRIR